jgi:hypothetical protein
LKDEQDENTLETISELNTSKFTGGTFSQEHEMSDVKKKKKRRLLGNKGKGLSLLDNLETHVEVYFVGYLMNLDLT